MDKEKIVQHLQQMRERLSQIQIRTGTGFDDLTAMMRQMIAAMEETLRKLQEAEAERLHMAPRRRVYNSGLLIHTAGDHLFYIADGSGAKSIQAA